MVLSPWLIVVLLVWAVVGLVCWAIFKAGSDADDAAGYE